MNKITSILTVAFVILLGIICSGCIATKYQSGRSGYSETRLSEHSYQVRFQGNDFTSQDRTWQFILRRCAELTLEKGKRYFTISSTESQTTFTDFFGLISNSPSGQAIMTILDHADATRNALDAVVVIQETNGPASGRLSDRAQIVLSDMQAK